LESKSFKPAFIPTLVELLLLGAKDKPVPVTTGQLAKKIRRSQQLASKHLDEMEKDALIERVRSGGKTFVKITPKGVSSAISLYSSLANVFGEPETKLDVRGTVFSGLGEGAYYIAMKGYRRQFKSKLGFDPYPGTLNLRLESAVDRKVRAGLDVAKGIDIHGFKDGKRSFGGAECFRATLNGKLEAAVLIIERTSHDDSVLEIIAPVNIRRQFNLHDGDEVQVTIILGNSTTEGKNNHSKKLEKQRRVYS
jgi:riboflavin kinase, archaea type